MTAATTEDGEEIAENPDSRPSSTTAPSARSCDPKDLRISVTTNRAEYAPDDWITATTTIRNVGRRTCHVPQSRYHDGCNPAILVHLSFPAADGTYGDTTWTFGPYPACPPPALTLEPGESEQRINRFRFGQGRNGELPEGDWEVISDWGEIDGGDGGYPVTLIRCKPGTCRPQSEYMTTTTRRQAKPQAR